MEFKTAILSIPAHLRRAYSTIGHLETMGFNIIDDVKIYEGADYREDLFAYGEQMKKEQFTTENEQRVVDWFLGYMRADHGDNDPTFPHVAAFNFGYLGILKRIIESGEPTLIISCDILFKLNYDQIRDQFDRLVNKVGYSNIDVAMLYHKPYDYCKYKQINKFWSKGPKGGGDTANLWTPHGARRYIDNFPYDHMEVWIGKVVDNFNVYCSNESHVAWGWANHYDSGYVIRGQYKDQEITTNDLEVKLLKGE